MVRPVVTIDDLVGPNRDPDSIKHAMGQLATLSARYEAFLESEEEPPRADGIHASEISYCTRRIAYSISLPRPKKKVTPFWRRKFSAGHMVHNWLQNDFTRFAEASGQTIHFEREVKISPKTRALAARWGVYSSCDGIFSLRGPDGRETTRAIVEIKTASKDEFAKLKEPEPAHIEQAHVYMAALNIPFVWFFYWNKDNHTHTSSAHESFLNAYDPYLWSGLEERFQAAHDTVSRGELPPKQEGFHCELCVWGSVCKPDYLAPRVRSMSDLVEEATRRRPPRQAKKGPKS
jgi:CRISPR/Cas system-associated exonuclease Cas4 (RecB family)